MYRANDGRSVEDRRAVWRLQSADDSSQGNTSAPTVTINYNRQDDTSRILEHVEREQDVSYLSYESFTGIASRVSVLPCTSQFVEAVTSSTSVQAVTSSNYVQAVTSSTSVQPVTSSNSVNSSVVSLPVNRYRVLHLGEKKARILPKYNVKKRKRKKNAYCNDSNHFTSRNNSEETTEFMLLDSDADLPKLQELRGGRRNRLDDSEDDSWGTFSNNNVSHPNRGDTKYG